MLEAGWGARGPLSNSKTVRLSASLKIWTQLEKEKPHTEGFHGP